jgi:hypothetical protein
MEAPRPSVVKEVYLFNHLFRSQQQRRRDREAEGLGRLEVDDELEFVRLLARQIDEDLLRLDGERGGPAKS